MVASLSLLPFELKVMIFKHLYDINVAGYTEWVMWDKEYRGEFEEPAAL